jgi:phospholipid/cholesterol/gamma-HCH transport system ATP-binding protein
MLEVKNVHKCFGTQQVLRGVSLSVQRGSTLAIVGPSGVGKSVLLKLILGIFDPDRGEVTISGRSITKASGEAERNSIRSDVGVLFQSAALFDSLTVFDNIAFPLRYRTDFKRQEIAERVFAIMQALSLTKYAKRFPEEISLGIRKRVGIARALILEPGIFLLDEPNTGLDPLDGQEVYQLINECKKKWDFAAIVISHEIPEVFQVSDEVAMILNGRIIAQGSPESLIDSTDPSVQQFLRGTPNGPISIR